MERQRAGTQRSSGTRTIRDLVPVLLRHGRSPEADREDFAAGREIAVVARLRESGKRWPRTQYLYLMRGALVPEPLRAAIGDPPYSLHEVSSRDPFGDDPNWRGILVGPPAMATWVAVTRVDVPFVSDILRGSRDGRLPATI